jgi:hypothetical protein
MLWREYQNFSVGTGISMLFFDSVFLLTVGIYLDYVMPREFGKRRNICFCFICKCCRHHKKEEKISKVHMQDKSIISPIKNQNSGKSDSINYDSPSAKSDQTYIDKIIEKTAEFECKYMKRDGYEPILPEVAALEA